MKDQIRIFEASAFDLLENKEEIKILIEISMKSSFDDYDNRNNENIFNKMMSYYFQDKAIINLAVIGNKVCGFVWFFQRNNDTIHINHFAILNKFQKNGIGFNLLKFIEKKALKEKIHYVELNVSYSNKAGVNFYKKNKFEKDRFLLTKKIL